MPQLEWIATRHGIGVALAEVAFLSDKRIADNSKKAVFLELRQKQLAMGHPVRCHSHFHLFDTKELV
ncbi:MAG: hypothetical protein H0U60_07170 [Blastocatellia bacterium]|nr:hypothetical protein [Blastocatellia bacterium]